MAPRLHTGGGPAPPPKLGDLRQCLQHPVGCEPCKDYSSDALTIVEVPTKEFLKNLNEQDARRRLNFAVEYLSNIMPQPLEISLPQNMIDFDRLDEMDQKDQ